MATTERRMPEWEKSARGGIQPMSQERRHGGGNVRDAPTNFYSVRGAGGVAQRKGVMDMASNVANQSREARASAEFALLGLVNGHLYIKNTKSKSNKTCTAITKFSFLAINICLSVPEIFP